MTSCDTNILFAALESSRPGHREARTFLDAHRHDTEFGLCELVLAELYLLLRNPVIARAPLTPDAAVEIIQTFRANSRWDILDYPGPAAGIMDRVWERASAPNFARRKIFDVRLALTLDYHGVTEFATANRKDFEGFDFERVWNPLEEEPDT